MAKKTGARRAARTPAKRTARTRQAGSKRTTSRKASAAPSRSSGGSTARATTRAASARRKKAPVRRAQPPARGPRGGAASAGGAALAEVRGATERREVGGVRVEGGPAGEGRVKRMIYPPGYSWSAHTKPHVGTEFCMHAHVGFLTHGRIDVVYADGCVEVFEAPQIVAVAPGHDGHVVGDEAAVLIEFDFAGETAGRFGMPDAHRHD